MAGALVGLCFLVAAANAGHSDDPCEYCAAEGEQAPAAMQ